jgi:peptidoglycan/LPS O-acetylase OafA/YrhL
MAGILIRAVFTVTGVELINPALRYAFPFVSGAIAMGCLLAIAEPRAEARVKGSRLMSGPIGLVVIPLVLFLDAFDLGTLNRFLTIVSDLLLTYLVARCIYVPNDYLGRLLNSHVLIFLGKLSYSLYLWQQLFFQHYTSWSVCRFPWNVLATATAASASYFLLERPFLSLRRKFRREQSTLALMPSI